ncbi:MAG: response regulator transcription factor [Anaerolineae bacterium]|jgi:two-component system KDP operon response regulator KdpE|nr:response regulator transcription factor [Anaerolineae bacterium]
MRILIVEDDVTLQALMSIYLRGRGYEISIASGGCEAVDRARENAPDLILLDVMMPGMDGWEAITELRRITKAPVLFLTALGSEEQVVRGLELGADDYLRKPVGMKELAARVAAVLRRAGGEPPDAAEESSALQIDLASHTLRRNGKLVHLTPTEFRLLAYLAAHAGRAVTHRELLCEVWGPEYAEDTASLQVYIRYLREKVEPDPKHPTHILTEWGIGYKFT